MFYGCRKYSDDCLYRDEWLQYTHDIPVGNSSSSSSSTGTSTGGDNGNSSDNTGSNSIIKPNPNHSLNPNPNATDTFHSSGVYVSVAFSQEKTERQPDGGKTYVIHKIRTNSKLVWKMIRNGAIIFVAGSAKRMPIDVRKAFIDVVAKHMFDENDESDGNGIELTQIERLKAAEIYFITNLERKKRYIVEAWS